MNNAGLAGRGIRNIGEESERNEDAGQYSQGKSKTNNKVKTDGYNIIGDGGDKMDEAQSPVTMPTLEEA